MPKPIRIKVDAKKLDKSRFFHANSGAVYIDLIAFPLRNGPSQYGDTHIVKQSQDKDEDVDLPIVGNMTVPEFAEADDGPPSAHQQAKQDGYQPQQDSEDDDIPF